MSSRFSESLTTRGDTLAVHARADQSAAESILSPRKDKTTWVTYGSQRRMYRMRTRK